IAFFRAVLDRLSTSPGVASAALGVPIPFSGENWGGSFEIEGRAMGPGDPGPHAYQRYVTPGYFTALEIPLRGGRYFSNEDRKGSQLVAVVDANLARQYWPGQNPVGQHIRRGTNAPWETIVGVVAHVKHSALVGDSDKGVCYHSLLQTPSPDVFVLAKTNGDAAGLAGAIREAVRSADNAQPVHGLKTMDQRITESLGPRRFAVTLLAVFAGLSLLLSALGLYALVSYTVAQRTHEIGIRVSLGAQRSQVLALMIGYGLRLALIGVVLGAAVAFALARLVSSQLYGVGAFDLGTFGLMGFGLVVAALAASYVPARRAAKVDPVVALRYE
ncbi:MAG TPA: FtsX-like permease family protein, partial [Terriglobia bacterium]|nr:FtsX-like permease family protein [Terriglobia bacterium]